MEVGYQYHCGSHYHGHPLHYHDHQKLYKDKGMTSVKHKQDHLQKKRKKLDFNHNFFNVTEWLSLLSNTLELYPPSTPPFTLQTMQICEV